MSNDPDRIAARNEIKQVLCNFERITEKNKCIHVRFLDWVAEKLMVMSKKVTQLSNNIHSPCVLKLPTTSKD
jgi:glucose-6-phosphate dehydrogenase assembly protein OpcA